MSKQPYDKEKRRQWYLAKREENLSKNKEWRDNNKERKAELSKIHYEKTKQENPIHYMLKYAKARAKKKGLEFTLVESDIIIPELCYYFNKPLVWNDEKYCPSIDRIDCTKGYTKDNIQIISVLANRMKWNSNREELLLFCKTVLEKEDSANVNPR